VCWKRRILSYAHGQSEIKCLKKTDPPKLSEIDTYTYPEYSRANIPPVGMAKNIAPAENAVYDNIRTVLATAR
jgi:hypothetical protein